jgi:plastocyanin
MKPATYILLSLSIVSAIIALQISNKQAPVDSAAQGATKASVPATQPTAKAVSVKIDNFTYQPKELEVAVGTTVTWQNADDVPHTATSKDDPQVFDSGALDTDEKFSFTFSKPGKYAYYCKVHPHMTGVVIVK